jgi:hypothetical protein
MLLLAILCVATQAPRADWTPEGTVVCKAPLDQWFPLIAPDGKGGAVIAWRDQRWMDTPEERLQWHERSSVCVQRLDASGDPAWSDEGVLISKVQPRNFLLAIAPDGEGGAFIAWSNSCPDDYHPILYAQHIDASGEKTWSEDGVIVCTDFYNERCRVIPDGEGGAIIGWRGIGLRAQRIAHDGNVLWTSGGVVVGVPQTGYRPELVSDGAGGAIFVWNDGTLGFQDLLEAYQDIYAQRVDATGAIKWGTNGVTICSAPSGQVSPQAVSDGFGGAIVAWMDSRMEYHGDLYAQRVDKDGAVMWQTDGIALCSPPPFYPDFRQQEHSIIADGVGGAIVTWTETLFPCCNSDIYAQRIDGRGTLLWKDGGLPVCADLGLQTQPQLTSDLAGGAIIAWDDYRFVGDLLRIYAQRVDAAGNSMWAENGITVGNLGGEWAILPPPIVSDGSGGAIIGWYSTDSRQFADLDIRALRLNGEGEIPVDTAGEEPPDTTSEDSSDPASVLQVFPNPFNPQTRVSYYVETPSPVTLTVFDCAGRRTRTLFNGFQTSGRHEVFWDGRDNAGRNAAGGVYFCRITTGTRRTSTRMVLVR